MKLSVYDYIKQEETAYNKGIDLEEGWNWSMKEHLRKSFLLKNFQFIKSNENRWLRPFKNIILGILRIAYRLEGFDVKDIDLYVQGTNYYKSFLVKKYHDKWAIENKIDGFIDEVVVSYTDFGGALVRDTSENRPEVVDLRTLAFCNQKSLIDNPFCIKHSFTPQQLRTQTMWGDGNKGATITVDELIVLCKDEKEIDIYELHGILPSEWLKSQDGENPDTPQIQVIAYYQDLNKQEVGVTLFKNKEPKLPFKMLKRDDVKGRALGLGGTEELFEAQKWTNWNEIKITEMLDAAAKTLHVTDDPTFSAKHPTGLKNVDNNEVLVIGEGKTIRQMDTYPRNLAPFNDALSRREMATKDGNETLLGESPTSGTPFALFQAQNVEAKGIHQYRRGQIAAFIEEVYRDWILPHIQKEIVNDHEFLVDLSADELQTISEQISDNSVETFKKEKILNGEIPTQEEIDQYKMDTTNGYNKNNRKLIQIIKDDFKNEKLSVMANIAGKQKNLAMLTDKLVGMLRQMLAAPQMMQDPGMVKLVNMVLESSGLSPINFAIKPQEQQVPQMQPQGNQQAINQLTQPQQV